MSIQEQAFRNIQQAFLSTQKSFDDVAKVTSKLEAKILELEKRIEND